VLTTWLAVALLSPPADRILSGAKAQLVKPAQYTGAYYRISYPNGDVPADRGACTDVVIRALRHAGYDLQRLIHEDSKRVVYPRIGKKHDRNIDHRRVPNQRRYFERHGVSLTTKTGRGDLRQWRPGNFVFWKLPGGLDHVGIISDRKNAQGLPLVIHNIWQTAEEDVLMKWKIVGHFRFPKG